MVNKDEWNTKEGRGKSTVVWQKRHLLGWSYFEQQKKIKPVALAIVELHKSEDIRQAVS